MSLLVLVVDDEPDVEALFRQQFRRELRAERFMMMFAQSAAEALRKIEDTSIPSLILILSDINMPGMSGLELLPKAKAIRPDVPIIMITAYGDAETRRKALDGGAESLLTKPIDFGALRGEIEFADRTGGMNCPRILVVDDEPDLESCCRKSSGARSRRAPSFLRLRATGSMPWRCFRPIPPSTWSSATSTCRGWTGFRFLRS